MVNRVLTHDEGCGVPSLYECPHSFATLERARARVELIREAQEIGRICRHLAERYSAVDYEFFMDCVAQVMRQAPQAHGALD